MSALRTALHSSTVGNTEHFGDTNTRRFINLTSAITNSNDQNVLPPWEREDNLVSPYARDLARLVLRCGIQQFVIALGVPGNVLNLAVFLKSYRDWAAVEYCIPSELLMKQGLRDRINLLLFSLALADLINLLLQLLQSLGCFMDTWDTANWETIMLSQVVFLKYFGSFVSGLLMAIMAVDRCLSVALPFKAARILSWRRMLIIVLLLSAIIFIGYGPNLFLYKVRWTVDPNTNRSKAYLATADYFAFDPSIPLFIAVILHIVVKPLSMIIVIICSSVTIVLLRRATKMRRKMKESQTAEKQSETKVTHMLLFLCITYVVCMLLDTAGALTNFLVKEFYLYKKYHNLFRVCYYIINFGSCINSSVNFFAYVALSTKFRTTLGKMIPGLNRLCPAF